MIRYQLDDLGPYQFEKLAQSLLKAVAGLSVESWGNRADLGRDAYCETGLYFPNAKHLSPGPFLFQAKFVEGANASGARPKAALLKAVAAESSEIRRRRVKGKWIEPGNFTFLTNSPISSSLRLQIMTNLRQELPGSQVCLWGGDDVCDLLDQKPQIARAFPQLLSIRDLDFLLKTALNRQARERSEAAIEVAKELVPVFVPTGSYEHTWRILRKHHFVVLEGPPEVGKSAIAWMVGLTQAGMGWEAIVCRGPETFFEMYERDRQQVFIADDAFGRTEYDPTRTTEWESDLDLILHRIDRRHWLLWTSRKHILERACERMDAQGKARSFPDPAAVLVKVQDLSVEERAVILFRHAKAAGMATEAKRLVRTYATDIVLDVEFTPERMRRFVHEGLPSLVRDMKENNLKGAQVKVAIKEALRNPTKQMRIAFQALPPAYKWLLVALLEVSSTYSYQGNMPILEGLYTEYCPADKHESFARVTDHLTEAFVKRRPGIRGEVLDWIHPSYRDLVIDELIEDAELRTSFLRRASLNGIKIAVSDTGGLKGERKYPFIRTAESWDLLLARCLTIVEDRETESQILVVLANATSQASSSSDLRRRWEALLSTVTESIRNRWNRRHEILNAPNLEAFLAASTLANPGVEFPELTSTWNMAEELFRESLARSQRDDFEYAPFDYLVGLAKAISIGKPSFLVERDFPAAYEADILAVIARAESDLDSFGSEDPDYLRTLAGRAEKFADTMDEFAAFSGEIGINGKALASQYHLRSSGFEEAATEGEPPEEEPGYDAPSTTKTELFDIAHLFSEL